MIHIDNHLFPADLDEAARMLSEDPSSQLLCGCGYLRLSNRTITTGIDLSRLGLDTIQRIDDTLEIGAMASLRDIETHPLCQTLFDATLPASVSSIVGVQLRSCVTIGGSVAGRYAFSDPLTVLLALNARLRFHLNGEIGLEEYLHGKGLRDILTHIILPITDQRAAFTSVRRSATDYAILNTAVACSDGKWRIVVGARPGRSILATEASDYLERHPLNETSAREAGKLAEAQLQFGDNPRASSTYRKAICPVLVRRAVMEIYHGH